jgi:DNA repair protein RadC
MELALVVIALSAVFLLLVLLFVFTHLGPLTPGEVEHLAGKRRDQEISRYFSFHAGELSADRQFKKRMKPKGAFYRINEDLSRFPSITAALLKYKKHEWVIIAFEKDKHVTLIWANKGPDGSTVSSLLSTPRIAEVARQRGYSSVLTFHNHPNPSPSHYDCTSASQQDLRSASLRAQVLNTRGLNLLALVCERGRHYRYFRSPADSFLPLSDFVRDIDKVNGSSRLRNLSLHLERIF